MTTIFTETGSIITVIFPIKELIKYFNIENTDGANLNLHSLCVKNLLFFAKFRVEKSEMQEVRIKFRL